MSSLNNINADESLVTWTYTPGVQLVVKHFVCPPKVWPCGIWPIGHAYNQAVSRLHGRDTDTRQQYHVPVCDTAATTRQ